jgi:hypothetical protein
MGKFLGLQNSVFDNGGLLQKRNGFGNLTVLPNLDSTYLTTFNENLTAIGGGSILAYAQGSNTWVSKGTYDPVGVGVLSLIKNSIPQTQVDSAVSPNGLVCTVYTETNFTAAAEVTTYNFVIADSTTGQNIVEPTAIPVLAASTITGSPRVFLVGNYFVIVSTADTSGTFFLQYSSISILNPAVVSAAQNVYPEAYVPASTVAWDGAVADIQGGTLVVAYNSTTGGQGIHVTYINQVNIATNNPGSVVRAYTASTDKASIVSVCADTFNPAIPVFYVSFYSATSTNGYTLAVEIGFGSINTVFTPQAVITSETVLNLASAAYNGTCTLFSEISNTYGYDSNLPSNYVNVVTISAAGSVGSAAVSARSIGLASKAFLIDGIVYYLAAYGGLSATVATGNPTPNTYTYGPGYQPSYFMIDGSTSTAAAPIVVAKLAYENGGGYLTLGLPSVTVTGNTAQVAYLYKDDVQALTTLNNTQQTTVGGIYSQTGINLATVTFNTPTINSVDVGSNLNLTGGFGWIYDGYLPVENNFFLWPDSVECAYTETSTVTPTGTTTINSTVVTSVTTTGVYPGMTITGTDIPSGTSVVTVSGSTITMSAAATATHTGTVTIQGNIAAKPDGETLNNAYYYQVDYEWTDNQGNPFKSAASIPVPVTTAGSGSAGTVTVSVPTLRLTYKTANPIKIVIYRWSAANPEYHQVTSITAPILNSTTVDYITFVDTLSDAAIQGNNLIYTTGGVVEDVNPPACNGLITLFDTRAWQVSAEDPNELWYSKQVIEGTPVEWSDLFTFYVAPNQGTTSTTGPITAIAPMDDKLIIFKKDAIYYINGTGPDNTGADSQYPPSPIFISSTVGCTNQNSITLVQGPDNSAGLMFQSDKGIYYLGNASLVPFYIGAPVKAFNGSVVTSANAVPQTNQARFTLNTGQQLIFDYFYQQWGTFVGAPAISSCIYNGLHTILNQYGAVLQETPGEYLDGSNPVLLGILSNHIQTQGISGFQVLWEIQLLGSYFSPHLLNVQIGYDYGPLSEQALIQPTNYTGAYGSDSIYGQTSPYGGPGQLEQWRIQPSTQQCQAFQISIQEVYDPSFGVPAGAGFNLSAMSCTIGEIRGYRPVKATNTTGTS